MTHRYGIEPPDDGPRDEPEKGCDDCGEPTLLRGIEVRGRLRFLCGDCSREAVKRLAWEEVQSTKPRQMVMP